MAKVVIIVRGGIVSEVYSDDKDMDVEVLDMDEEDDLDEINRIDKAYEDVENDPKLHCIW